MEAYIIENPLFVFVAIILLFTSFALLRTFWVLQTESKDKKMSDPVMFWSFLDGIVTSTLYATVFLLVAMHEVLPREIFSLILVLSLLVWFGFALWIGAMMERKLESCKQGKAEKGTKNLFFSLHNPEDKMPHSGT